MSNRIPTPVEEWAPSFLTFGGASDKKFTPEQVLDPNFAITFDHCKLCDCNRAHWPAGESTTAHLRRHKEELKRWLGRRKSEAAKKQQEGLAAARRNRAEQKAADEARTIIDNPDAILEGGDDDE